MFEHSVHEPPFCGGNGLGKGSRAGPSRAHRAGRPHVHAECTVEPLRGNYFIPGLSESTISHNTSTFIFKTVTHPFRKGLQLYCVSIKYMLRIIHQQERTVPCTLKIYCSLYKYHIYMIKAPSWHYLFVSYQVKQAKSGNRVTSINVSHSEIEILL